MDWTVAVAAAAVTFSVIAAAISLHRSTRALLMHLVASSKQPGDVIERVEALERRVAAVHEEALRYLRQARTARSRAQQLRDAVEADDDDDGTPTIEDLRAAVEGTPEPNGSRPSLPPGQAPLPFLKR